MNPLDKRVLGSTGVELPLLGFGGAQLGGLFETVLEQQAHETLDEAYAVGIRYYDTAPWYGHGLSEHRVGHLLRQQPRHEFLLSTKVGRLYHSYPGDTEQFKGHPWVGGLPFEWSFDYSAAGLQRSFEDSTLRLGMNRIDLLVIHDLDTGYHGKAVKQKLRELESGISWLNDMKVSGIIRGFGAGINDAEMMPLLLEHYDLDFFLVAMPYTLLDQGPLDYEFQLCERRGMGVIIGAPYASGILATGSVRSSKYGYTRVEEKMRLKVQSIERICENHGVPLKAAALQFPLGHPLVASVIPGSLTPEQVRDNLAMMRHPVSTEFWSDLKQAGLLHPEAQVPL